MGRSKPQKGLDIAWSLETLSEDVFLSHDEIRLSFHFCWRFFSQKIFGNWAFSGHLHQKCYLISRSIPHVGTWNCVNLPSTEIERRGSVLLQKNFQFQADISPMILLFSAEETWKNWVGFVNLDTMFVTLEVICFLIKGTILSNLRKYLMERLQYITH